MSDTDTPRLIGWLQENAAIEAAAGHGFRQSAFLEVSSEIERLERELAQARQDGIEEGRRQMREELIAAVEIFEEPRELLPKPTLDELEKILNSDEPLRIQVRPDGSIWAGPSKLMQEIIALIQAIPLKKEPTT